MPKVSALCLTNLAFGLDEEGFKKEVFRIWGDVLKDATFRLFKSDGNQRKGVVSGFKPINFSTLQEATRGEKLNGRNICLKADTGEPRDDFGNFLQLATPLARRERDKFHGKNFNQLFLAFHPELLDDLGRTSIIKKILTISPVLEDKVLQSLGHYTLFFPTNGVPDGGICVRFHTSLETMQANLYLSGNEEISSTPPTVSNPFDTYRSRTTCGTGMGIGGQLLDFVSLNRENGGFVPFSSFKQTLLDGFILGRTNNPEECIGSKCWRCGNSYKLLGIDMDLGYLAGNCSCVYMDQMPVADNRRRAYAWDQEPFTRLVLGEMDTAGRYLNLRISHYPMSVQYESPSHYCEVIVPILEDEWKVVSTNFRETRRIQARLLEAILVETIKINRKGKEKRKDVYALQIRVGCTKLWCSNERSSLRTLYLNLALTVNGLVKADSECHKGRVWSVREQNGHFYINAQVYLASLNKPNFPQDLEISAKATKTEYEGTRRVLNKFEGLSDRELLTHPYLQLLLNPFRRRGWALDSLEKEDITIQDFNGLQYLIGTLNDAQKLSFERAIQNSLSVIQGPPGTGKTHNASVLAIALAVKEVGTVIACAPSNEAADNLAFKIATLLHEANIPLSVLRVESKSKEAAEWDIPHETGHRPYHILRDLVQLNLEACPISADLASSLKLWMEGKSHMLKHDDREALELQFANIEKTEARMYAIQVYTIATLGDGRAKSFAKKKPVTTIVVDEIGQATQPSLIMLSQLCPKRIVLTGDHLQLQPHVESQSSADAGLNKSALELVSSFYVGAARNNNLPPWTMLDTQYRMHPIIRKLVSEVTYGGKLLDAEYIFSRSSQLPSNLRDRPLIVLDHKALEVKMGQSYANPVEAALVVNYVRKLLDEGVKPHLITILSLYESQKLEIDQTIRHTLPGIELEVLNVDAFQGRENAIIIVSFTRSNIENIAGFTKSPNRLNVAISRAKEMLVIAANMTMFGTVLTKNWKIFTRIINEKALNY